MKIGQGYSDDKFLRYVVVIIFNVSVIVCYRLCLSCFNCQNLMVFGNYFKRGCFFLLILCILYDVSRLILLMLVLFFVDMIFLVFGINYKMVFVSLRECVSFSLDKFDQVFDSLFVQSMVQGGVVLSMCNCMEFYFSVEEQDNL